MATFLIDSNLPYFFSLWKGNNFLHVNDIGDTLSDSEVWDYARTNGLTIVTKDADFSLRMLFAEPPPRVIHLRIGNLRMAEFHSLISKLWPEVIKMGEKCKLVNVYPDRIEGIQ